MFRTPIVHSNAVNPVWNWQFELRLPADLGAAEWPPARSDAVRFTLLNAMTVGEPEKLCACEVGVGAHRLMLLGRVDVFGAG